MRPVLFWVWSYPISTHDFFVLLGVLAGVVLVFHEARRRDMLDDRLLLILAGSLVCGAAAARLSALWRYAAVAPDPSVVEFVTRGGRSIPGGLPGPHAGALVTKRLIGYPRPTSDVFAPSGATALSRRAWGWLSTDVTA